VLRDGEWDCPVIPLLAAEIGKDDFGQEAVLESAAGPTRRRRAARLVRPARGARPELVSRIGRSHRRSGAAVAAQQTGPSVDGRLASPARWA